MVDINLIESGLLMPSISESGSLVSFNAPTPLDISTLKVAITPVQSGTGDPSPDNIRPITGWTGANIIDANVTPNADKRIEFHRYYGGSGTASETNIRPITAGVTLYKDDGTLYRRVGTGYLDLASRKVYAESLGYAITGEESHLADATTSAAGFRARLTLGTIPYAYRLTGTGNQVCSHARYYTAGGVGSNESESRFMLYGTSNYLYIYINGYNTLEATAAYFAAQYANGTPVTVLCNLSTPIIYNDTECDFDRAVADVESYGEPLNINYARYPITWSDSAGTVYGGELDVLTGKLTAYPYYASYAGETINGEWISDRDVYAEGITPTIGAQVAVISGTGTEYTLTATEVQTLLGINNIWADCGDITLKTSPVFGKVKIRLMEEGISINGTSPLLRSSSSPEPDTLTEKEIIGDIVKEPIKDISEEPEPVKELPDTEDETEPEPEDEEVTEDDNEG